MTGARAAGAVAMGCLFVLAGATGCRRDDLRTSKMLLSRESGLAFERAFQTRHRMATGRFDEHVLERVASRCTKLEVNPRGERPWHWRCVVSYLPRPDAGAGPAGRAAYSVVVDPRGCFTATSRQFPARAWDSVLRRPGPNPLRRFRSCP